MSTLLLQCGANAVSAGGAALILAQAAAGRSSAFVVLLTAAVEQTGAHNPAIRFVVASKSTGSAPSPTVF